MMRIANSTFYQQAVDTIDRNQTQLGIVQEQMSSNTRLLSAADDPVAAGQVIGVNQSLADVAQWQSNAGALQSSLGLEDSTLSNVSTALGKIQTLALQANNATLNSSDRKTIATQIQQQLNAILQQANTQDANGRYLFGGTQDGSAPFSLSATGANYNGNSNVRMLSLGPTSAIAAGDPGDAVFMQLQSGDGSISAGAATANTGSASVKSAQVTDASQWSGSSAYTVKFSGGQYQVVDGSNATVASGTYTDGAAIQFRGVSLTLTGTPADGDSFSIAPSTTQSLFSTVQNLINVVSAPVTTAAQRAQNQTAMYGALQALSGAQTHITDVQAGVGAREQSVNDTVSQLQSRSTQLQSALSGLQDLDYAAATAKFSQTTTTLQAAEQSYVQIQGLSLFNYIK
ncbi:flagellar hook-associated protein FlgL [Nevskia soli]|uniref:flagellar hook-associated protein FlgL n=1 Tax=Nevskia soli TaxID=418856 RepID=UPI0004A73C04|nr:flagellar hook-associated protein FlgL [Nevskia soli]